MADEDAKMETGLTESEKEKLLKRTIRWVKKMDKMDKMQVSQVVEIATNDEKEPWGRNLQLDGWE